MLFDELLDRLEHKLDKLDGVVFFGRGAGREAGLRGVAGPADSPVVKRRCHLVQRTGYFRPRWLDGIEGLKGLKGLTALMALEGLEGLEGLKGRKRPWRTLTTTVSFVCVGASGSKKKCALRSRARAQANMRPVILDAP